MSVKVEEASAMSDEEASWRERKDTVEEASAEGSALSDEEASWCERKDKDEEAPAVSDEAAPALSDEQTSSLEMSVKVEKA